MKKYSKKSMILWIIQNNKMSLSRKIGRIFLSLTLPIQKKLFQSDSVTLLGFAYKPSLHSLELILHRIEVFEKRGLSVRLKLSITGIAPWEYCSRGRLILSLLEIQAIQPIFDLETLCMRSSFCHD